MPSDSAGGRMMTEEEVERWCSKLDAAQDDDHQRRILDAFSDKLLADRRALLAAVEALRKLCGEAAHRLENGHAVGCGGDVIRTGATLPPCDCGWADVLAKLRAAARQPEEKA